MRVIVKVGDILDERVDVLVCPANGHLVMTGGLNLAIFTRGAADVERELQDHLHRLGRKWVAPGTAVVTGPGPLAVRHIIHAVAIDGVYKTGVALVRTAIENALSAAVELGARTVALPALATGYGRLPTADFAEALRLALERDYPTVEELRVVVRKPADAEMIERHLLRSA